MRSTVMTAGLVALFGVAGCGDDGGGGAAFGEPVEVDDLTVTVGAPYRYDWSPEVVRVDVTFETDGDEVPTPNPTLECDGEEFEIDHDAANYAAEVSADEPEDGEWAWAAGPDCEAGRFAVGDAEYEFDEVEVLTE